MFLLLGSEEDDFNILDIIAEYFSKLNSVFIAITPYYFRFNKTSTTCIFTSSICGLFISATKLKNSPIELAILL